MAQITVKVRYDELPKPAREDFLLEEKDGLIQRKELSEVLKEIFVEKDGLIQRKELSEVLKEIFVEKD